MNQETTAPLTEPHVQHSTEGATKTPLYEAYHNDRYHRQDLIRDIQDATGRVLLSYVAGVQASIQRDDVLGFVDLLCRVEPGSDVDLIIHSGGGDIDAAEKLISMVRAKVGEGTLRVVVPDYAKSAATLMALGAHAIVMSDSSELGPIDPQVPFPDGQGSWVYYSAFSYLEAFRRFKKDLEDEPTDETARLMLAKMDPHVIVELERVYERTRHLAEGLLQDGMTTREPVTAVVTNLLNNESWYTHGQVISATDADMIGLMIERKPPDDPTWTSYWALYCLERLEVGNTKKLFESDFVSLNIDGKS